MTSLTASESWKGILLPARNKTRIPHSSLEFDFSWNSRKVAVEIQGGIDSRHRRSGHVSPPGMRRDMLKMCLAQHHGWVLFQLAPEQVMEDIRFNVVESWLLKALRRHEIQSQPVPTGHSGLQGQTQLDVLRAIQTLRDQ